MTDTPTVPSDGEIKSTKSADNTWSLRDTLSHLVEESRPALSHLLDESRPAQRFDFIGEPHDKTKVGLCLSGGGIRSAAYCLGAIQRADAADFLSQTNHISAVSGGGYIAAARFLTERHTDDELLDELGAWAPGSPEAQYLRANSDYLAPGLAGRLWLSLNTAWGVLFNIAPLGAASVVIGGLAATVLRESQPGLHGRGVVGTVSLHTPILLISAGLFAASMALVGLWRRSQAVLSDGKPLHQVWRPTVLEGSSRLFVLAAGLTLVSTLALPVAVWTGRVVLSLLDQVVNGDLPDVSSLSTSSIPIGTDAAVLTVLLYLLVLGGSGVSVALARRSRALKTMLTLAGLTGPLLLVTPGLAVAHHVFADKPRAIEFWGIIAAAVVCVLFAVFAHNGRYSMHLFYRERLAHVFAVKRSAEGKVAKPNGDSQALLSEIAELEEAPELILCTSLNVSDRVVPRGRQSASFVFTPTTSGSPVFDDYFQTKDIEKDLGLGSPDLSLASIVAISGAALSPVMGRLTIKPLRFLLAVLNVRLGVWIPNPTPAYVAKRAQISEDRNAVDESRGTTRPAKMWLRLATAAGIQLRYPASTLRRQFWRHVEDGWHEPGALYVWREAIGSMKLDRRFLYITDGGHWDNLGLVELVRRRCTRIVCLDASLDPKDSFEPLQAAISLCRSDLGVEIDIDPRPLTRNSDGVAEKDTVIGTIRYGDQEEGRLVYTRATISEATPAALALYANDHAFPDHSTGDQFFSDDEFEAFRALGFSAAERSLAALDVPGYRFR